ncbi:hypothetical protein QUA30_26980, partial [Microcoleus sp. Pol14C2]|uniref:hypothetical protein n=1 Tax=unclassified Microcoleus TaxID=2642155 RepID=UPI002FD76898
AFINKVCGLQTLFGLSPKPLCHPLSIFQIKNYFILDTTVKNGNLSVFSKEMLNKFAIII